MKKKPKLVVLTGAGISAESGLATFRAADGLWEGHDVMEVASPQGWKKNPELVLEFYNQRRRAAKAASPNEGHKTLVRLEVDFDVTIITQNVDNLHERAGSGKVIHLHGKLFESRSTLDHRLVYQMETTELNLGDKCEKGSQLRPNIVWFGEAVPMMELAIEETSKANVFAVIGTSLAVYPAAGLLDFTPTGIPVFIIDPTIPQSAKRSGYHLISENASTGVRKMAEMLNNMSF